MKRSGASADPAVYVACGVLTEKILIEFAYSCFHGHVKEQTLFVTPVVMKALTAFNSSRFALGPAVGSGTPWKLVTGLGTWHVSIDDGDHSDEPEWAASSFEFPDGELIARLEGVVDYAF